MKRNVLWSAVALALGTTFAWGIAVAAQGGNRPPVESSNNLSFPAVLTAGSVVLPGLPGTWTLGGEFPESMSFGCAKPEVIGSFTYPNTSCVTSDGTPLSYEVCATGMCSGLPVERIYYQKQAANVWQAQNLQSAGTQVASFVDWGDNLESVTWSATSIIRVETTPFVTEPFEQLGFQMWHVFGQGPEELWGAHATDKPDLATPGDPYGYMTPYAIIRSPYARLNLTKLEAAGESCGTTSPYADAFVWNVAAVPAKWVGAIEVSDLPYTPELNIGGKFVYGYNWNVKRMLMPGGVEKAGWWRLTFYAPDVQFALDTLTTPPVLPDAVVFTPPDPVLPAVFAITAEEEGPLYVPVVDSVNHITYMDVCLSAAKGGGKKVR